MSKRLKRDDVPASDMLGDPAFPHHIMNYDTYYQGHNCTWWVILWWWNPGTPLNITFFGNETSWPNEPDTIMLPYSEPGFCYDCFNSTSFDGTCLDRHPEAKEHNNKPMYGMEAVLGLAMVCFLLFCGLIVWKLGRSKKVCLIETDEEMRQCQEEVKARDEREVEDINEQSETEATKRSSGFQSDENDIVATDSVKVVAEDEVEVEKGRNSRFLEGDDGAEMI